MNIKQHLKEKHGDHFQDCNFGIEHNRFNTKKRKLSAEEAPSANAPTKGKKGKPVPPPTPPPSQTGVILLDFTGFTVTGTPWNYTGDIICTPANLTSTQVDEVLEGIIAEYATFNIIITTDEAVYNLAPINKRMRVIFTETYEWYGMSGGVSFVGSFTWNDNTPCFVFTSLLGYNTKSIKEAGAHEIGHTIGLYHQSTYDANCVKTSEYNYGDDTYAPIMGVAYYKIPKWWVGPNSLSCTNIQDDSAILTNNLK